MQEWLQTQHFSEDSPERHMLQLSILTIRRDNSRSLAWKINPPLQRSGVATGSWLVHEQENKTLSCART
jgi:hypothetical protein